MEERSKWTKLSPETRSSDDGFMHVQFKRPE
jgi:hypothetical protein